MMVIVHNGNLDRALRELKKKLGREHAKRHLQIRNNNPKPSERRKAKAHEAANVRLKQAKRREWVQSQREKARLKGQRAGEGQRQAKVRPLSLPQRDDQFKKQRTTGSREKPACHDRDGAGGDLHGGGTEEAGGNADQERETPGEGKFSFTVRQRAQA